MGLPRFLGDGGFAPDEIGREIMGFGAFCRSKRAAV
jgi:hypothetical protein